jgi:L-arabinokinase
MHLADSLAADYAAGAYQLCLPFGPNRSSFPDWERAPLVARTAKMPKSEVISRLELGKEPIAVVCLGGWKADEWPSIHARPGSFQLLTVNHLPITAESRCRHLDSGLPFGMTMPDLIAAADVVLGKPGYGLASECLRHRIPFAMIDRPNFRETPYLVSQMQELGHCTKISIDTFLSGEWAGPLDAALSEGSEWADIDPSPEHTVASRIVELIAQLG